jgi:hypothetical protein
MFSTDIKQTTNDVFMIRPAHFGFNPETAENNSFQSNDGDLSAEAVQKLALAEFEDLVRRLRDAEINVHVFDDTDEPVKTDAVFPNNWVSFHLDSFVVTYPMYSLNRRQEKREEIIDELSNHYSISKRYSFDYYEEKDQFLEGTGSMILDRENQIIYACLSERTNAKVLEKFAVLSNFRKLMFHAVDRQGAPIYHTNVMMAIGQKIAVVCLECIPDELERKTLKTSLENSGKVIIEISLEQVESFAGNVLELKKGDGSGVLVMSQQAFKAFTPEQIGELKQHVDFLYSPIPTIEKYGGGSVRCMIAEIFLNQK